MGAMYSRVVGTTNPNTGLPTNRLVLPGGGSGASALGGNFETGHFPTLTAPGELDRTMQRSTLGGGDQPQEPATQDLQERFSDRRNLLAGLDGIRREVDSSAMEGLDRFQQQAFDVIVRKGRRCVRSHEGRPGRRSRSTTQALQAEDITKWYDMKRASNLLGKQMLPPRRLCEAGCGFVTVSDCGWDMHANNNSPKDMAGLPPMSSQVGSAVAAFIEDIHERGLQEQDSPGGDGRDGPDAARNNGGRDHYANLDVRFSQAAA
ncbi:MAG: DUF1501 domain-containing protein [Gemmataceae bacterium]